LLKNSLLQTKNNNKKENLMEKLSFVIEKALSMGCLDIRHTANEQAVKLVAFTTELCCCKEGNIFTKDCKIFIPEYLLSVLNDEVLEYKDIRKLVARSLIHFAALSNMSKDYKLSEHERYIVAEAIINIHKTEEEWAELNSIIICHNAA
jgi:hypothetical protein